MTRLLNFLLLLVKSVLFIWAVAFLIILVLFFVGHEAEGLTTGEKMTTAAIYGIYVATLFGSLLAIYISFRDWRIARQNRKILARKEKAKQT